MVDSGGMPAELVGHGDHVCLEFASVAEQQEVAAAFVRAGLDAGDRVWYLADRDPGGVLVFLRSCGVVVDEPLASGQLVVLAAQDTYLRELPFDPERTVERLHEAREESLAAGYRGFRVTGEMRWGARLIPGAERLEEYERRVQAVFDGHPAAALCQYDRRIFATTRLDGVVALHPTRARRPLISADGILRISHAKGWLRVSGELDLSNRSLLVQALGCAAAGGDIHIDAHDLEFIDLSGIQPLLETAAALAPDRRLVLEQPNSAVRRVVELLGAQGELIELSS